MKHQAHNQNKTQFNPLSPNIESIIHTTNSQLEIWTDCVIGGVDANKAYNLSYSIKFSGEFISEAFMNPEFQFELDKIIINNKSSWTRFLGVIRELFGVTPGALLEEVSRE